MSGLDRRQFLRLAGAGTVALATAGELDPAAALARSSERSGPGRRQLRELRRLVRGRVLVPGDQDYSGAHLLFNERFDGIQPPAVVQVDGIRDVKAVVRWANRYDVKLTARSGGHSYGGYSTTAGGVVVDLRGLRWVRTSNGDGTATVAAGAPLAKMYSRLASRGLTVPGGTCPTVGIAGLALGGGVGMASRKLGLTSDNLTSVAIVTPDGRFREVDARNDPDLFWACQGGGGGNFGIATNLTFTAHPVSTASYFHASWPWEHAADALDAWQRLAPEAPPELSSGFGVHTSGRGPKVSANGQLFGSRRRLRRLLAPLAAIDGAELTFGTEDYGKLMLRWSGCEGESVRSCLEVERDAFYAASDYAAEPFDSSGRQALLDAIEAGEQNGVNAQVILDAYGGAINRIEPEATAFVHRGQLFGLQYIARYTSGGRAAAADWVADAHRRLHRHVSGQAYQNYIDPRLRGWKRAYYGDNYERLVDVKTRYDPEDRLRFRQGIRPQG